MESPAAVDPAPEQILTVAQMRAAEAELIANGSSVDELMQRAGRGAAELVWRMAAGGAVTVLVGPGNNGGDGWVIAQDLHERGAPVRVVIGAEPTTDAARKAKAAYRGPLGDADSAGQVFVDCLFGAGLSRPLEPAHFDLLVRLRHRHDLAVAIDLPSGIEADSGELLNPTMPSFDVTIALGSWKFAHWQLPARDVMGQRRFVPIGVERQTRVVRLLNQPSLLPPAADAHKYTRGFLGVIGGYMPGASMIAALAAMRSGAGYVKLFGDPGFGVPPPDLVFEQGIVADCVADPRLTALLVGPGLGRDALAREKLEQVLARELPTVVDGDALHLLDPSMLVDRRESLVLTPHGGELERLYAACEIEPGAPRERLYALAHDTGSVVVAKGPDTIIAAPDGTIVHAGLAGAPRWLSIAGTGDVLAGIIASRLSTGRTDMGAASEAVWLHATAARRAGPACTPMDIVAQVSDAYVEILS